MAAYRLYTVIPRLLSLVDELTNWYIRFNRKRLKGENGKEDTVAALNTLFETLFTLCCTMSSYTPFFTESIYQGLRPFIPSSVNPDDDHRSIHFISFPEVKEEYFDVDIERRVKRMQSVIELTRTLRERHTLPLKTPLKELVVFHPDEAFHDDVRSLVDYIQSELNVRNVEFTSDEEKIGIRYRADADWPTLGRKLRNQMAKVKKALPSLSSDDIKGYVQNGKILVDGIELVTGDLAVSRYVDLGSGATRATNTEGDIVVILDIEIHLELETEGLSREFINRVQKLRKKVGLQATDDVDLYYKFEDGSGDSLKSMFQSHTDVIVKSVRASPKDVRERPQDAQILVEEEQEISDVKFLLSLVRR
jgi:isoleucyl-tRNA synthetase